MRIIEGRDGCAGRLVPECRNFERLYGKGMRVGEKAVVTTGIGSFTPGDEIPLGYM
jgi:hypothetical protein